MGAKSLNTVDLFDESKLPSAKKMRIGIVVAEWNKVITGELKKGCLETLLKNGALKEHLTEIDVPGSFELIAGAELIGRKDDVDAVICLGCVVKGQTRHDEYINHAVAQGLTQLNIKYSKPFIFGLLTTENEQQAYDRAGGSVGHKGVEAAITAIKMVFLYASNQ